MAERKTLEIVAKLKDLVSKNTGRIRESISRMSLGISRSFQSATRAVFNMRTALLGLAGGAVAREFVSAGASVQRFRVQLEALMQDEARAAKVLNDIRRFAAESPLETENLVEAFVNLEAVGVPAAERAVKQLGNVAVIFNRDIRDVASGFIGVETEVLRRLGVELKRAGDTAVLQSGKIRIETENTTVAIREALLELWGKRFPNAMERAGTMWDAQMAKFRGALFELRADMVAHVMPSIGKTLDRLSDAINRNRDRIVAMARSMGQVWSLAVEFIKKKFDNTLGSTAWWARVPERAVKATWGIVSAFLGALQIIMKNWREVGSLIFQPILTAVAIGFRTLFTQIQESIRALVNWMSFALPDSWVEAVNSMRLTWDEAARFNQDAIEDMLTKVKASFDVIIGEIRDAGVNSENIGGALEEAGRSTGLLALVQRINAVVERNLEAVKKTRAALGGGAPATGGGPVLGSAGAGGQEGDRDPNKKTFWQELKESIANTLTELSKFEIKASEIAQNVGEAFQTSFGRAFKNVAKGMQSVGDAMKSILDSVLERIADVLLQIAAMKAQALASRALLGAGFNLGFTAANGAIMAGGWQPAASFAAGGIVRGPTLGILGDNSSRVEAAVPMPDGKHIPVDLRGGGQSEINVNFTVVATDPRGIQQMLVGEKRTIIDLFREALATEPGLRNEVRGIRR